MNCLNNIGRRTVVRGDIRTSQFVQSVPLTARTHRARRAQDYIRRLWTTALPNIDWHPHAQRHRALMERQWLRDGRHHLRHWHCLGICHFKTIPAADATSHCLPRSVTSRIRHCALTHAAHPLPQTHWLLGQRPQMAQPCRQTPQVRQHLTLRSCHTLEKNQTFH